MPGQGQAVRVLGDLYVIKLAGADTGGAYALIEAEVMPQSGPPPHIHRREDEAFYLLEGEVAFRLGDRTIRPGPGTFLNIPKGNLHTFKNTGPAPARMLVIVTPAGLEKFFLEAGRPMTGQTPAAGPPSAAEIEKLFAIAPKYGIEIRA